MRIIHWLAIFYVVGMVFLAWGFAMGRHTVFPFNLLEPTYVVIEKFVESTPEDDRTLIEAITQHRQLRRNEFSFKGLRVYDKRFTDTGHLLISRFSEEREQVIIQLMRLADGQVLHTWIPPIEQILTQGRRRDQGPNSVQGYRAQHPLLLSDGSVVFHSGEGPLVRLHKRSRIVWVNDNYFHHSIELDHTGKLVVPIHNERSAIERSLNVRDDGYAILDLDGKILQRFSLGRILINNGYQGLFLGVGNVEWDRSHLNDAQPIQRDQGDAKVGDVAISTRYPIHCAVVQAECRQGDLASDRPVAISS